MSLLYVVGACACVGVFIYLVYALLKAEEF